MEELIGGVTDAPGTQPAQPDHSARGATLPEDGASLIVGMYETPTAARMTTLAARKYTQEMQLIGQHIHVLCNHLLRLCQQVKWAGKIFAPHPISPLQ